jgi:PAS domain S-box-containing protein
MSKEFIHHSDFSNAFQYAAIGMALVSLEGRFMRVNPSLCRLLGYSENEFKDLRFQDITHPEDLETDLEYAGQLFRGEIQSYNMEKRYITKSGEYVWILLTGSMVTNDDGSPKHFIAQIQDISAQKSFQATLEQKERRFRGIFNSAFQFIGLLETDGTLIEANSTALNFSNLKPEDVVGKKFWDCYWWTISDETQDKLRRSIEKAAQGETIIYEVAVWDANKNPQTILFNLKPVFNSKGEVASIIPEGRLIQDIVDAREALLRKNEELERFASVAAHDMKEPLRMISQFMTLLKSKYQGQLDEKANKYIDVSIDGAKRMSQLIQDILDYARIEDKNAPIESVSLENVVLSSTAFLEAIIEESGAKITWDKLPDVPGRPTALRMMFQNLIGNALKYRKPNVAPIIHISAKKVTVGWEISVSDNGLGIPEEYLPKIFDMFVRVQNRTDYPGTGMGLATCRKIAQLHGGDIRVESELNKGSVFTVILGK